MKNLPKNFPEYIALYRNLKNKLDYLEKSSISGNISDENSQKIIIYEKELEKIRDMFPKNFFENYLG